MVAINTPDNTKLNYTISYYTQEILRFGINENVLGVLLKGLEHLATQALVNASGQQLEKPMFQSLTLILGRRLPN